MPRKMPSDKTIALILLVMIAITAGLLHYINAVNSQTAQDPPAEYEAAHED